MRPPRLRTALWGSHTLLRRARATEVTPGPISSPGPVTATPVPPGRAAPDGDTEVATQRIIPAPATRASRGHTRAASIALAITTLLLVATGCSLTGSASETVSPTTASLYPELATYPDIPVIENVQYGVADGFPLLLDVCLPATEVDTESDPSVALKPRAAVVSIHGGSWAHGDKSNINWRSVCQWLASEGYVAVSVNYRLAPSSVFPAAIKDVRAAVRWLRDPDVVEKYSIDPDLIGVFGGSAGGNLAALLGTEGTGPLDRGSRVAAVAELSGPTDLTENGRKLGTLSPEFEQVQLQYLGCGNLADCPRALTASPLYDVDATDPPFFVAHSFDERIPIEQSEIFVEELRDAGIDTTFVTVDGTLHSIAMLNSEMRDRIADFFASELVTEVPGVVP
jgi:acetyl esterase